MLLNDLENDIITSEMSLVVLILYQYKFPNSPVWTVIAALFLVANKRPWQ